MILYLELGSASLHNVLCNIKEGKRPALTDTELYTIVEGILEALHYLSTQDPKVIHRDIKVRDFTSALWLHMAYYRCII